MEDKKNPNYIFSMTDTGLLLDTMFEIIDLRELVKQELANRGLDYTGKWIGFNKAKKYWDAFDKEDCIVHVAGGKSEISERQAISRGNRK